MSEFLFQLHIGLGAAYAGYKLYTYVPSTVTPRNTFTTRACTPGTENTNPIILNAIGAATVYAQQPVKLKFTDAAGTEITAWGVDNWGFEARDYLQGYLVIASSATTGNSYAGTTTPAPTTYENGLTVVLIPDVDSTGTLGATVFTGAGLNDAYYSGRYTGDNSATITVNIDANGTPDTFKWRKDSGAWTAGVAITGAAQLITEGVYITFPKLTGHTIGNYWTLTVNRAAQFNLASLGAKRIYKNIAGTLTVLDSKDLTANVPAKLINSVDLNCWVLAEVPLIAENHVHDVQRVLKTATYTIVAGDQGKEISCTGTWALNLTAAATLGSGFWCYARNSGSGIITLTANGTELIYGPDVSPAGATTAIIAPGATAMVQCDGIDFHLLNTASVPAGSLMPYGAAAAPVGWLLCDGTAVSRTTYAYLFSVISTTYGVGDGVTTFNVPDMRGKFPFGKAAAGTGNTLGGTFGAIDHTHTTAAYDLPALGAGTDFFDDSPGGAITKELPIIPQSTSSTGNPPGLVFNFIIKY